MKPSSSTPGEHGAAWQTPRHGSKPHERLLGDLANRVEPTAEALPGRCAEVVPGQSVAPGLFKAEGSHGELHRNARGSSHGS